MYNICSVFYSLKICNVAISEHIQNLLHGVAFLFEWFITRLYGYIEDFPMNWPTKQVFIMENVWKEKTKKKKRPAHDDESFVFSWSKRITRTPLRVFHVFFQLCSILSFISVFAMRCWTTNECEKRLSPSSHWRNPAVSRGCSLEIKTRMRDIVIVSVKSAIRVKK